MSNTIIKTTSKGWLTDLSTAYKNKESITLIDDAEVGINPESQTILQMGKQAGLSYVDWVAVGVSLGMSAAGIWMVVLGAADPEPTSKLGLLIGGGIICVAGGGFSAIRVLTKNMPPNVKVNKNGFEINWA